MNDMTEQERLDLLIRYHTNLTQQFIGASFNDKGIASQINRVEEAIEDILFSDNGSDENES